MNRSVVWVFGVCALIAASTVTSPTIEPREKSAVITAATGPPANEIGSSAKTSPNAFLVGIMPASFSRTASSHAISSKGFIDSFWFARSTPEPSDFTRALTL